MPNEHKTIGQIARENFSHAAGADSAAKNEVLALVQKFSARMQHVRNLVLIPKQEAARAALAADGITIDDADYTLAFQQYASDETRRGVTTKLHAQIVDRLTAESTPIAKRLARAVIANVGADLAAAEEIERRFRQRYGISAELATLRGALEGVVGEMQQIVKEGHDLSLSPRPCHILSSWFPGGIDLAGFITH